MPIKGMSYQEDARLNRALPTIAVLKKGGEGGENRIGKDLSYFRVVFKPEYAFLQSEFEQMYGTQPDKFEITLLPGNPQTVFTSWYQAYSANQTLKARCDGETIQKQWRDKGYDFTPSPCHRQNDECPLGCEARGYLPFMLPDFMKASRIMGLFVLQTGSAIDINTIASVLELTHGMCGACNAVEYTLSRVPRDFAVEIKGKRSNVTKYMISLVPSTTFTAPPAALPTGAQKAKSLPPRSSFDGANWKEQVYDNVRFLYDHEKHMMNSVAKLLHDGDITTDMQPMTASLYILHHKIVQLYESHEIEWDDEHIHTVLDCSLGQYVKENGSNVVALMGAWNLFVAGFDSDDDIPPYPATIDDDIPF